MMSVRTFRNELLASILKEIAKRRLIHQIDYIVYSSGFPYAVDFLKDFPDEQPINPHKGRLGSLTGMTYLHEAVRKKSKDYATYDAEVNHYYGGMTRESAGFSAKYSYNRRGRTSPGSGSRYFLSTMLAYTAGRGNTVDEVIRYLNRAASADGTDPRGTVYLMQNNDARSIPRHGYFDATAKLLRKRGVRAEIIAGDAKPIGVIPIEKRDVAGLVVGYASFNWLSSRSKIMPGAICEHFTSYGGVLKAGAGQTPLTEFLRHGAAGASGTVCEPYAIIQKFPHPMIQYRYASGCSLAESFYQAVSNPYQLLIVGDPLCRPWARIPLIRVDGVKAGQKVTGNVNLTPSCSGPLPMRKYRLFVDGRLAGECSPGKSLSMDTTKLADGYHEIRIVGIDRSDIETQGRLVIPIEVANTERSIACRAFPSHRVTLGDRVQIRVNAPEASEVMVYHGRRALAAASRPSANIVIDTSEVGAGPVELIVVAKSSEKGAKPWFANPVKLDVTRPVIRTPAPVNSR